MEQGQNVYRVIPELQHCEDEVNEAANRGDIEKLKEIAKREGIEWIDYQQPEK